MENKKRRRSCCYFPLELFKVFHGLLWLRRKLMIVVWCRHHFSTWLGLNTGVATASSSSSSFFWVSCWFFRLYMLMTKRIFLNRFRITSQTDLLDTAIKIDDQICSWKLLQFPAKGMGNKYLTLIERRLLLLYAYVLLATCNHHNYWLGT